MSQENRLSEDRLADTIEQIGEVVYRRHERGWIRWPLVEGDEIKARLSRILTELLSRRASAGGEAVGIVEDHGGIRWFNPPIPRGTTLYAAPSPSPAPVSVWHEGEPPKPWRDEWFIALTIHGDRVVLRSLPEEWTYDYKTADETYMMAKNIKRWMQFPDSIFKPAPALHPKAVPDVSEEMVERAQTELRSRGYMNLTDQDVHLALSAAQGVE